MPEPSTIDRGDYIATLREAMNTAPQVESTPPPEPEPRPPGRPRLLADGHTIHIHVEREDLERFDAIIEDDGLGSRSEVIRGWMKKFVDERRQP